MDRVLGYEPSGRKFESSQRYNIPATVGMECDRITGACQGIAGKVHRGLSGLPLAGLTGGQSNKELHYESEPD